MRSGRPGDGVTRGAVSAVILVALGCATPPPPPPPSTPVVDLRSPEEVPEDFRYRQEVTVAYQGRPPRSFDAVLDKKGAVLKLVGLTPINTVLFVAELKDQALVFDNRTGEPLPFEGSFILRDVQRAFFPWLSGPVVDGRREGWVGDTRVVERFEAGELRERRFHQVDAPPVRVRFDPAPEGGVPRVTLIDEALDYRLDIQTF